jgi:hypothetical protein
MKQILLYSLVIITVTSYAQKDEVDLVKKTFSSYKKSILEGKGSEAAKWVDGKTLAYYESMLKISLYSDSSEVQKLGLMDKLIVLSVRHRIPKSELAGMTGKDFFSYSVDKGMVGKNSVMTLEIGEVKVSDNFANGEVLANGQKAPLFFQFNKEEGQWKLDLTSLFPATTAALKKVLTDNGMTENDFVFKSLEMITGKPVGNVVWHPLK